MSGLASAQDTPCLIFFLVENSPVFFFFLFFFQIFHFSNHTPLPPVRSFSDFSILSHRAFFFVGFPISQFVHPLQNLFVRYLFIYLFIRSIYVAVSNFSIVYFFLSNFESKFEYSKRVTLFELTGSFSGGKFRTIRKSIDERSMVNNFRRSLGRISRRTWKVLAPTIELSADPLAPKSG